MVSVGSNSNLPEVVHISRTDKGSIFCYFPNVPSLSVSCSVLRLVCLISSRWLPVEDREMEFLIHAKGKSVCVRETDRQADRQTETTSTHLLKPRKLLVQKTETFLKFNWLNWFRTLSKQITVKHEKAIIIGHSRVWVECLLKSQSSCSIDTVLLILQMLPTLLTPKG